MRPIKDKFDEHTILHDEIAAAHLYCVMTSAPDFAKLDPATPEFWNVRFDAHFTPWDQRGVPQSLRDYLATQPAPHKVLIPGCGAAHEVKYFIDSGWTPTAIDFSPAAVAQARALLATAPEATGGASSQLASPEVCIREGDFFTEPVLPGDVEVVYERAFLCALPRRMWADWAIRVAELLPRPTKHSQGGRLIGFFFSDTHPKGPPFGLQPDELEQLLTPAFTRIDKRIPTDSIPIFSGKESWQVWVRN